jgi:hypothetical protein
VETSTHPSLYRLLGKEACVGPSDDPPETVITETIETTDESRFTAFTVPGVGMPPC